MRSIYSSLLVIFVSGNVFAVNRHGTVSNAGQSQIPQWEVQTPQSITGTSKSGSMIEIDVADGTAPNTEGMWHIYSDALDNLGQNDFWVSPVYKDLPDGGGEWTFTSHGLGSNHQNDVYTYTLRQTLDDGGHMRLKMPSGYVVEMRSGGLLIQTK